MVSSALSNLVLKPAFALRHGDEADAHPPGAAAPLPDHDDYQRRSGHQRVCRASDRSRRGDGAKPEIGLILPRRTLLAVPSCSPLPGNRFFIWIATGQFRGFWSSPSRSRSARPTGGLIVSLDFLLRISSNPFFSYLAGRIEEGMGANSMPAPPVQ